MNFLAYLDPGTGSYLFQLLMASFFALVFVFVNMRKKTMDFLKRLLSRGSGDKNDAV